MEAGWLNVKPSLLIRKRMETSNKFANNLFEIHECEIKHPNLCQNVWRNKILEGANLFRDLNIIIIKRKVNSYWVVKNLKRYRSTETTMKIVMRWSGHRLRSECQIFTAVVYAGTIGGLAFFPRRSTFIHCLKAVATRMLASRCAVIKTKRSCTAVM